MEILWNVLGILGLYVVASFVGWLSVQDIPNRPFNWRFIWLPAYHRWLDRTHSEQ